MSTTRVDARPATLTRPVAYWGLTKPDVTFLVVITTLAGYYMGSSGPVDYIRFAGTVFGTTLMAMGTASLNHYIERNPDSRMRRTANRPLPIGSLQPREALVFGLALDIAGAAYLVLLVNPLACLLGVLTTVTYLGVYTPLKRHTHHATTIGSFPGALPPLIGWAAARGSLSVDAWVLFGILFFWQFPHFLSIAWMYRKDYERAGIRMISVGDSTGTATFGQIIWTAAVLVPVSLLPAVTGLAGIHYFFEALILGMLLVQVCVWAARSKSNGHARWLMHATAIYLPLLLALMMLNKIG
ncbi:MAG TPA: heme o synthase [Candidatus Dormibacteraeota bacterium]|nr:heme o synthase [Candidatus Dormibacteraeota bacterium]